jgi:hypothetical protein
MEGTIKVPGTAKHNASQGMALLEEVFPKHIAEALREGRTVGTLPCHEVPIPPKGDAPASSSSAQRLSCSGFVLFPCSVLVTGCIGMGWPIEPEHHEEVTIFFSGKAFCACRRAVRGRCLQ